MQDSNHDACHVQLALGDIVSRLPDSRNGLVVTLVAFSSVSRSRLKQIASRCVATFLEGIHYEEDQGVAET